MDSNTHMRRMRHTHYLIRVRTYYEIRTQIGSWDRSLGIVIPHGLLCSESIAAVSARGPVNTFIRKISME